jgi:hypothetical protein
MNIKPKIHIKMFKNVILIYNKNNQIEVNLEKIIKANLRISMIDLIKINKIKIIHTVKLIMTLIVISKKIYRMKEKVNQVIKIIIFK